MKNLKKNSLLFILALCLCFSGCSHKTSAANSADTAQTTAQNSVVYTLSELFTDRDYETDTQSAVAVTLADNASTTQASGVSIEGNTVTITAAGSYRFSGTLTDGCIVVDAADTDKIQLVLDNAAISCGSSAALYVRSADKVFVTLEENSTNTLTSTGDYVQTDDNNVDAAVFSKSDLTLNGSGSLTVSAQQGHGILSKDDLAFTGGSYTVTAASQALSGKDSVRIAAGSFQLTSGKDGLHAENTEDTEKGFIAVFGGDFTITAQGDGLDASGNLFIENGTFTLTTGGGSANASTKDTWGRWGNESSDSQEEAASAKGLKAEKSLTLTGGSFTLDTSDDALHTNGDLTVTGGTLSILSGDDGLHADSALMITGGDVDIQQSYEGIEAQSLRISGGNISVTASDDGLNAAGGADSSSVSGRPGQNSFEADSDASIVLEGGTLVINADGDGIDSNGSLTVTGGTTLVYGPTNDGNGALDYTGAATISGGTLAALGSSGMAQNFGEDSTQGSILYTFDTTVSANTSFSLCDAEGTVLAECTSPKTWNCVVVSAPGLTAGETYTLKAGDQTTEVTLESLLYGSSNGMMGGFGGGKNEQNGSAPSMPDGSAPSMPDGSAPSMPDGSAPSMPDGSAPSMPDGSAPSMPDGSAPSMPDGDVSFGGGQPLQGTAPQQDSSVSG